MEQERSPSLKNVTSLISGEQMIGTVGVRPMYFV